MGHEGERREPWVRLGLETAQRIAAALGTELSNPDTNRITLNGRRAVIKTARKNTTSVGVTHRMLEDLDEVIGALEQPDGTYRLLALNVEEYRKKMGPRKSRGTPARVGIVARKVFEDQGRDMGTFDLDKVPQPKV